MYSLGYKPPINSSSSSIGLDRLSFDNYRNALSGDLFEVFTRTLRISLLGTALCLVIAFPLAYWLAVKVPSLARLVARARDRAVLDELPHPHRRVADRAELERVPVALDADGGVRDSPIRFLDTREAVQLGVVYNYLPP